MIEVTGPDEIYIIDLGSAAGTFVNGQRSNKARLQNGDEIAVGETRLVVEIGAGDEDSTMAVDRSRMGVDFAAMAAEHADPSASAPMPAARPAAPRPAPKGTLIGMQAPAVGSVPPPAAGLVVSAPGPRFRAACRRGRLRAPPQQGRGAPMPSPFANPFAAPGCAAPAAFGGAPPGLRAERPMTQPGWRAGLWRSAGAAAPEYEGPRPEYLEEGDEHPERVRYGLVASAARSTPTTSTAASAPSKSW